MALTLLNIYNAVTGQAWSIDDSDISAQDEVESKVLTSIQKALRVIWDAYPYSFRLKPMTLNTVIGQKTYDQPVGNIAKKGVKIVGDTLPLDSIVNYQELDDTLTGKPEGYYIKYNKLHFYPIPDAVYQISIDYNSIYLGLDAGDNPIYNLNNLTDKLDIPEMYEDIFKTALMNKAMVNAIAADNSENYQPYIKQFVESYSALLNSISGVESEPRILF